LEEVRLIKVEIEAVEILLKVAEEDKAIEKERASIFERELVETNFKLEEALAIRN